ncbi:MAG: hypothetical protein Q9166_003184 [cf. Caloplaca sp. 2 TL-2023]
MTAAVEIPKQYRAAVYDEPGKISTKVETLDTPEPGPGEVLINLDLGIMENSWAGLPYPTQKGQVGGHEGVGFIVKMGPATERSAVKVGDRVGIKWVAGTCGSCLPCLEGADAQCRNGKVSGYYTRCFVLELPRMLLYGARKPGLASGLSYQVQEEVWLASRGMAMRVIGIDAGSKEKLVRDCGAEHFIDVTKHDDKSIAEEVVKTADGLGASAVIVCTASNKAYAQSIDMLRFGGTLVCVGMPEGQAEPIGNSFPSKLVFKGVTIASTAVGNRKDAIEALEFAARGKIEMVDSQRSSLSIVSGVVNTVFRTEKMERLTDVFHEMKEGKLSGRVGK